MEGTAPRRMCGSRMTIRAQGPGRSCEGRQHTHNTGYVTALAWGGARECVGEFWCFGAELAFFCCVHEGVSPNKCSLARRLEPVMACDFSLQQSRISPESERRDFRIHVLLVSASPEEPM